ncbi:MAG: LolA family protein [Bacillota bacterium]
MDIIERRRIMLLMSVIVMLLMVGCQSQDSEDVYEEIVQVGEGLTTYQAEADMQVLTASGEERVLLSISRLDDFYHVDLTDDSRGLKQTLVRNADGVFLLTDNEAPEPFRMEWPNDRAQLYLLSSVIDTLKAYPEATFEEQDAGYVYTIEAPLEEDPDLTRQTLTFDKETYLPVEVFVTNETKTKHVSVKFQSITVTPDFEADFFDVALGEEAREDQTETEKQADDTAGWYYPTETFNQALDETEERLVNGRQVVMMTYTGDQSFTLIQVSKSQTASVADVLSVIKDGASFTSDDAGFVWANETTEFYIASDSLTPEEKEAIATSVEWVENK